MFKRLFWLVVGAAFGFGVSFWLMRALRDAATRYSPSGMTDTLAGALRQLGTDLREAMAEGRAAMRETEDRIRSEIADPRR
jgi:hypothetical protein